MKYKFENFIVEIENPEISIDMRTIRDNAIEKLLSVKIELTTDSTKIRGVFLKDMPYTDKWVDEDVAGMVELKIKDFEV